jgi:hypothetical protein
MKEDLNVLFESEELSQEKLNNLGDLVRAYQDAEDTVESAKKKLKDAEEALRVLSRESIPNVLGGSGFSELRLSTGEKIIVKEELKAEIPKCKMLEAYKQMIQQKKDSDPDYTEKLATLQINSLFKKQIVIEDATPFLERLLLQNDIVFEKTLDIHWATLKKYCSDIKAAGQKIPSLINVFEYKTTTIKKPS